MRNNARPVDSCLDILAVQYLRRELISFERYTRDRIAKGHTIGQEPYSKHFSTDYMSDKEKKKRRELAEQGY